MIERFGILCLLVGCATQQAGSTSSGIPSAHAATPSTPSITKEGLPLSSLVELPQSGKGGAEKLKNASILWTKKMHGAISGLSISTDGSALLVATSPDKDIENSFDYYGVTQMQADGKQRWSLKLKSPAKDQDISRGGILSVISNYENELFGVDARGKVLWSVEGMCRPHILEKAKSILCYHDDDAEPGIAFDIFDWKGKKTFSFPVSRASVASPLPRGNTSINTSGNTSGNISKDVLVLKVSQDDQNIALALTHGQVILLDSNYRTVWQKTVEGEITDLGVSSGSKPSVAVLNTTQKTKDTSKDTSKDRKQKITVFDFQGNTVGKFLTGFKAIQLEVAPQGTSVFYYGNSSAGQYVGSLNLSSKRIWQDGWIKGVPYSSDYSYSISTITKTLLMGFEEITNTRRKSHLLAFDSEGHIQWDIPTHADEGAYLYSHKAALGAPALAVATDDAQLSLYRLKIK